MLPTRSMPIMTNGAATAALNGSGGAENDGALRGEDATIAVRNRRLGVLHLALAAFAAQLPHHLDQEEQAVHPGVTVREAATIGVDRQAAAGRDAAAGDELSALAFRVETDIT